MNTALLVIFFLFLTFISGADEAGTDYYESWTNNLHTDCEYQDLMEKLKKKDPRKCASAANGTDLVQWEECKKKLKRKIISMCPNSKMRQVHLKIILFYLCIIGHTISFIHSFEYFLTKE